MLIVHHHSSYLVLNYTSITLSYPGGGAITQPIKITLLHIVSSSSSSSQCLIVVSVSIHGRSI